MPDSILVVDNASPQPVQLVDVGVPSELVRMAENTGPAGGHASGLEHFLRSDNAVAWVMDDDCVPAAECLERLLERHERSSVNNIVLPWWVDGVTGEGQFCPAWCGFVVSKAVVERVGLPRRDLVWWTEDTEYVRTRMERAGVLIQHERDALVDHRRVRDVGARPIWKVYYEARNTVYFRLFLQDGRTMFRVRRMLFALGRLLAQVVRDDDRRVAKLVAFRTGVADGLGKRLGLRIPLVD
jgi:GT2 family glycosyltransferase